VTTMVVRRVWCVTMVVVGTMAMRRGGGAWCVVTMGDDDDGWCVRRGGDDG
jgi:hypothetical protein